jgi:hypothetical protein
MTIVNNFDGLQKYVNGLDSSIQSFIIQVFCLTISSPLLILKEYLNHSGTIFKVFVLGSSYSVDRRVSFPNFPLGNTIIATEFLVSNVIVNNLENFTFDSQKYKHSLPPELTTETTGKLPIPDISIVNVLCENARKIVVRI